ncbi:hypothetical protein DFH08DRAFT_108001 [Mycena albidolilacea]|uniref:Uncharacterized protein n=1 Tax=Mycena albidolilacea TaxID=1033008 RepID=A0AAD7A606_9AGAR|nr:hypothetical protein DFH08DRAFT_108001 [Mycena albidolilacea]
MKHVRTGVLTSTGVVFLAVFVHSPPLRPSLLLTIHILCQIFFRGIRTPRKSRHRISAPPAIFESTLNQSQLLQRHQYCRSSTFFTAYQSETLLLSPPRSAQNPLSRGLSVQVLWTPEGGSRGVRASTTRAFGIISDVDNETS